MSATTSEIYEWLDGSKEFQLRAQCNHDIDMTIQPDGGIEITQDGHGGWECCSSHTSRFNLALEDAVRLRDWLNGVIARKQAVPSSAE